MKLNEAKNLVIGEVIHWERMSNADGTCMRFRINGKVKTWKRDPSKVRVPLKRGLREYGYLTETNCHEFHKESECRRRRFQDLPNGAVFEFVDRHLGMARGPWIKTGARTYEDKEGGKHKVGSINVMTEPASLKGGSHRDTTEDHRPTRGEGPQ